MSKTAAQRRAARKRKEQHRDRQRADRSKVAQQPAGLRAEQLGVSQSQLRVRRLIGEATEARYEDEVLELAAQLARLDPDVDSEGLVAQLLMNLLGLLWEHGWQPADVAHVARRTGRVRFARLTTMAIARQAAITGARDKAPEDWVAQLDALDVPGQPPADVVHAWSLAERLPAMDGWGEALRLVHLLTWRGELPRLCPPPSQWGRATRRAGPVHHADSRVLGRIRGLLAKAESTEFPDEAEALTAKAQELMTRYAVDEAVLDAERGESLTDQVTSRRVHLENPYPEAKLRLLGAVGRANGVRVIYLEALAIATVVGLPVDLDLVDLLFTSLLIQATRAMAATGRAGDAGTRSPSFRRSFLLSYADRIGERLEEARHQATDEAAANTGTALVPVMQQRSEAVDEVFERMFPQTYSLQTRAYNPRGWRAGRLAAETADLGSGRQQVSEAGSFGK